MPVFDDIDVLKSALRNDFLSFVAKCFVYLNPGQIFHSNWHLEAISHKLDECRKGNIKRLVILLPPRHLKSTIVSVAWPAFVLGHFPETKFICASYGQELANKLSNDTRSIMNADWYRGLFPGTCISDQKDTQHYFETTRHGGRFATSVGGPMTGFGCDILIVDDPQKPSDMLHETSRQKASDWLFNTALSRFNDAKNGIAVLVMQRLGEDDLVGALENKTDVDVLKIPARADDPITYDLGGGLYHTFSTGDFLQEERFGPREFQAKRTEMGSKDFSAQYQQEPLPSDGGVLQWDWFRQCDTLPEVSELIMSVDVAATERGGNYTAVTFWGHLNDHWYLADARRYQHDLARVRQTIEALDKKYQPDLLIIDSGGVGNGLIAELKNRGYKHIRPAGASTSKLERAYDIAAMVEAGRVHVLSSIANLAEFKKEIIAFPEGKSDDFLDSMTQVLRFSGRAVDLARRYKRGGREHLRSGRRGSQASVRRIVSGPRGLMIK